MGAKCAAEVLYGVKFNNIPLGRYCYHVGSCFHYLLNLFSGSQSAIPACIREAWKTDTLDPFPVQTEDGQKGTHAQHSFKPTSNTLFWEAECTQDKSSQR